MCKIKFNYGFSIERRECYSEELEEKLVIDLKEGAVNDAYKDKIEIVSIEKDKIVC